MLRSFTFVEICFRSSDLSLNPRLPVIYSLPFLFCWGGIPTTEYRITEPGMCRPPSSEKKKFTEIHAWMHMMAAGTCKLPPSVCHIQTPSLSTEAIYTHSISTGLVTMNSSSSALPSISYKYIASQSPPACIATTSPEYSGRKCVGLIRLIEQ